MKTLTIRNKTVRKRIENASNTLVTRHSPTCFMTGWLMNSRGISMATMIFSEGPARTVTAVTVSLPVPPRSRWAEVIMMVRGQADSDSESEAGLGARARRPPSRGAGGLGSSESPGRA
jgi:hypothetical protein